MREKFECENCLTSHNIREEVRKCNGCGEDICSWCKPNEYICDDCKKKKPQEYKVVYDQSFSASSPEEAVIMFIEYIKNNPIDLHYNSEAFINGSCQIRKDLWRKKEKKMYVIKAKEYTAYMLNIVSSGRNKGMNLVSDIDLADTFNSVHEAEEFLTSRGRDIDNYSIIEDPYEADPLGVI